MYHCINLYTYSVDVSSVTQVGLLWLSLEEILRVLLHQSSYILCIIVVTDGLLWFWIDCRHFPTWVRHLCLFRCLSSGQSGFTAVLFAWPVATIVHIHDTFSNTAMQILLLCVWSFCQPHWHVVILVSVSVILWSQHATTMSHVNVSCLLPSIWGRVSLVVAHWTGNHMVVWSNPTCARHFITLASSVDRDINGGPIGWNWLCQWCQTLAKPIIYVLYLHLSLESVSLLFLCAHREMGPPPWVQLNFPAYPCCFCLLVTRVQILALKSVICMCGQSMLDQCRTKPLFCCDLMTSKGIALLSITKTWLTMRETSADVAEMTPQGLLCLPNP